MLSGKQKEKDGNETKLSRISPKVSALRIVFDMQASIGFRLKEKHVHCAVPMASKTKLNDALKLVEEKYKVKLREFQQATYQKLFNGKDVFLCAPTGSGKTFCFVFLSDLQRLVDGFKNPVVLVISPLSGLMVDQARRCQDLGLQASFIGELQDDVDVKTGIVRGEYELVFVTPESLVDSNWRKVLSSSSYQGRIKFVVVDEAHCISHW